MTKFTNYVDDLKARSNEWARSHGFESGRDLIGLLGQPDAPCIRCHVPMNKDSPGCRAPHGEQVPEPFPCVIQTIE